MRSTASRLDQPQHVCSLWHDLWRSEQHCQNLQGDSTELFEETLRAADEIGMDAALAYLGECVVEKRLAWLNANLTCTARRRKCRDAPVGNDPVMTGHEWFYEKYLRVAVPKDG